jgi:hypothetical protein
MTLQVGRLAGVKGGGGVRHWLLHVACHACRDVWHGAQVQDVASFVREGTAPASGSGGGAVPVHATTARGRGQRPPPPGAALPGSLPLASHLTACRRAASRPPQPFAHPTPTRRVTSCAQRGLPTALYGQPLESLPAGSFPIRPALTGDLVPSSINLWWGRSADGTSSNLHHE